MKPKLSQWHSADTKPVHVGVYETKLSRDAVYSYWNGNKWSAGWYSGESPSFYMYHTGIFQNKQWRGIVK